MFEQKHCRLLQAILYGKPLAAPDGDGNKCSLDGISNPDNVHYINGILLIAEDSGSHVNNVLWAYDIASGELHDIHDMNHMIIVHLLDTWTATGHD